MHLNELPQIKPHPSSPILWLTELNERWVNLVKSQPPHYWTKNDPNDKQLKSNYARHVFGARTLCIYVKKCQRAPGKVFMQLEIFFSLFQSALWFVRISHAICPSPGCPCTSAKTLSSDLWWRNLKWKEFWETFVSKTNNRPTPDVLKMNHLRSLLKDEAAKAIVWLPLASSNYMAAVSLKDTERKMWKAWNSASHTSYCYEEIICFHPFVYINYDGLRKKS